MASDQREPPGYPTSVAGEPAQPMNDQERAHFIRYTRPERWSILDRFPVSESMQEQLLAQMLVWPPERVRQCIGAMTTMAGDTADALLTDPGYRAAIQALPFRAGDRVAAVGDSLTADRLGWFDLITASMRLNGDTNVVTHNLGVSGSTTADALERFDILETFRPTHVLVMLGTNDARRHGRNLDQRMVSQVETRRNISGLSELIVKDLQAQVLFITPPPADQGRISTFFHDGTVRWSAAELDAVAQIVRDVAPHCIDVHTVLETQGLGELMESDGVHLNADGQQVLAREVLQALAAASSWYARSSASLVP